MNEARALRLAGVPHHDILTMATAGSAAALGISDSAGAIAVGGWADLVLLDGNPLVDIEALNKVSRVVKQGRDVYLNPAAHGGRVRPADRPLLA
jgi:imidazolonepropionase-like amidohydrolase